MENRAWELTLFDLGIDSKLRACDLVKLSVRDVCHGDRVANRATVLQQKTQRPVQFEISPATREAVEAWVRKVGLRSDDYLFPSRLHGSPHLGTRQYARILDGWVSSVGLDPAGYGTHSMRRTKASLIYRRTKNLRAVQLLLGHSKLDYLPRRTMSRRPQPALSGLSSSGHSSNASRSDAKSISHRIVQTCQGWRVVSLQDKLLRREGWPDGLCPRCSTRTARAEANGT